jgi:hypothetical protein
MSIVYADDAVGTNAALAGIIIDATPPKATIHPITYTPISNPDATEFKVPGKDTVGATPFRILYQMGMRAALTAIRRLTKVWTITYPDKGTETFQGILNEIAEDQITETQMLLTGISVMVTNAPTYRTPVPSGHAWLFLSTGAGAHTDYTDGDAAIAAISGDPAPVIFFDGTIPFAGVSLPAGLTLVGVSKTTSRWGPARYTWNEGTGHYSGSAHNVTLGAGVTLINLTFSGELLNPVGVVACNIIVDGYRDAIFATSGGMSGTFIDSQITSHWDCVRMGGGAVNVLFVNVDIVTDGDVAGGSASYGIGNMAGSGDGLAVWGGSITTAKSADKGVDNASGFTTALYGVAMHHATGGTDLVGPINVDAATAYTTHSGDITVVSTPATVVTTTTYVLPYGFSISYSS